MEERGVSDQLSGLQVEDNYMAVAMQALPHVLQHCPDPADLCSMLQVSTAIRAVLQQSVNTLTVEPFSASHLPNEAFLQHAHAVLAWLPKHSGLVSHLRCSYPAEPAADGTVASKDDVHNIFTSDPEPSVVLMRPERQLLLKALQACAAAAHAAAAAVDTRGSSSSPAPPLLPDEPAAAATVAPAVPEAAPAVPDAAAVPAAAPAAAGTAVAECTEAAAPAAEAGRLTNLQPYPLRLASFETNLADGELLQLLPAFHLRSLHLDSIPTGQLDSARVLSAVASLTALTELRIQHAETYATVPMSLVRDGIGRLPGLRVLRCSLRPAAGKYLPASLQELSVVVCDPVREASGDEEGADEDLGDSSPATWCDLRGLTNLVRLQASRPDPPQWHWTLQSAGELLLPRGLGFLGLSSTLKLQGLQEVSHVRVGGIDTATLLSALTRGLDPAVLLCLEITGTHYGTIAEHGCLVGVLRQLKGLTRLDIGWARLLGEIDGPVVTPAPWCEAFAALPDLRHLQLCLNAADSVDLLRLSALTTLTHLNLYVYKGLDETTAAAVLQSLTGLQALSLQGGLQGLQQLVPSLCGLTGLTSLRLFCLRRVHVSLRELRALSVLQQLQSLVVPLGPDCTAAAVRDWLGGMPCLDRVS